MQSLVWGSGDDAGVISGKSGAASATGAGTGNTVVSSIRQLSRANFKLVHERTTGQRISDAEVDVLFELFDADSDGELGLDVLQTTSAVAALQSKEASLAPPGGVVRLHSSTWPSPGE